MQKRTFLAGLVGLGGAGLALGLSFPVQARDKPPRRWTREWPNTDFSQSSVGFEEIVSGGPGKDGIRSIDAPEFVLGRDVREKTDWLADEEPVISLTVGNDTRAYPISMMLWHEIVNDVVGDVPVAVTYCPLCNSAVVFDRRHQGRLLDFGTTGKLRHSDMVMYDRQTESWWQQFVGEAIVGTLTGDRLTALPARIESFSLFLGRNPEGLVLIPSGDKLQAYGANPYEGYDRRRIPLFYAGRYRGPVAAMSRVISVGDEAWSLAYIREKERLEIRDLVITWQTGQHSPLHRRSVRKGRDIGNVLVQRRQPDGTLVDVVYDVPFAFAFEAFYPEGTIHTED